MKIMLILALSLSINCQSEIRGKQRDDYIKDFITGCTRSQRAGSANTQISDSTIKAYCSCTASYTADNLTLDQFVNLIDPISKGRFPDWFKKLGAQAGDFCVKNLSQY